MRTSTMADPGIQRRNRLRKDQGIGRSWCCSFGVPTQSPENRCSSAVTSHRDVSKPAKSVYSGSFHSFPSPGSRVALGIIDPRRILSPGRVSPMNSDAAFATRPVPECAKSEVETGSRMAELFPQSSPSPAEMCSEARSVDLRLILKAKNGSFLILDLDSDVLCRSSTHLAAMVLEARRKAPEEQEKLPKIEILEIENLPAFKDTVELMFEKEALKWLMNAGVLRAIDILEVSSTINFTRGVDFCINYLEAVPWNENEEEKLKTLLSRRPIDGLLSLDVLSRLHGGAAVRGGEDVALRLLRSIAAAANKNSRKILQTLLNALLSESSVYEKDRSAPTKEGIYEICHSCLTSLVDFFRQSTETLERLTCLVDSLTWLVELLLERHVAEDFVATWADQAELLSLRGQASPMVRFELSRVSACVFEGLGWGRVHCPVQVRFKVLRAWFGPMMDDFGWLKRCPRGLDFRALEESMGRAILTLSLAQQEELLVDWFARFSSSTDCPNLSRPFQIWWRRSFLHQNP